VVIASGGYPGSHEVGKKIDGLEDAASLDAVKIFHAGTSKRGESFYTSGGRVLGVTARAAELQTAVEHAYEACARISFEGAQYRKDIAARALKKS
jgi:phosphoribosylamine--glycine ligase